MESSTPVTPASVASQKAQRPTRSASVPKNACLRRRTVMKFGGTSVATVAHIRRAADRVVAAKRAGFDVIVVVSAMAGETNRLLGLAKEIADLPDARELDALAASGEQVVAALMAMAIRVAGEKARSFLGHQVPLRTDGTFNDATVVAADPANLLDALEQGITPVVAGFQGVDEKGNITTLGRGGSDTTAVAVAGAVTATCEIYTDVDGVYTLDPNVCGSARKIGILGYGAMFELAAQGAKVLHSKCVSLAKKLAVPVHVRSTFSADEGTWIVDGDIEADTIAGIAIDKTLTHDGLQMARVSVIDTRAARHLVSVRQRLHDEGISVAAVEATEMRVSVIVERSSANIVALVLHELLVDRPSRASAVS